MTDVAYVFDTYALLEMCEGNPKYREFTSCKIVITEFILAELCFSLIRKIGLETAYEYTDALAGYVLPVGKEVIKKAMTFRYEMRKRNMSMADCVGYFLAKAQGIKFLTGDKEFEGKENVEFVK